MGSSIVSARTASEDTAIIFFMVDDPSRISTLITLKAAEQPLRVKEFRNQNRGICGIL
jgi:hypothetical protein